MEFVFFLLLHILHGLQRNMSGCLIQLSSMDLGIGTISVNLLIPKLHKVIDSRIEYIVGVYVVDFKYLGLFDCI